MKIENLSRGRSLDVPLRKADTFWSRFRGLLGADPDKKNEALWITPCNSIHMLGMKRPLDILFLSRDLKVVRMIRRLPPNHLGKFCSKAHSVIEFFSGYWDEAQVAEGDQLAIHE